MNRHSVHVICEKGVALGFALAGIPTIAAVDPAHADRLIAELSARPETGVLLVQEELLGEDDHEAGADREPLPIIVPFPGPSQMHATERAEAFVVEILRQAIGYRVRLQ